MRAAETLGDGPMEMHQIRYFLSAVEKRSFSAAADACGVSQPALTVAIKKLEAELGGVLFHRDGKGITPTELARTLVPHLTQLLGEAQAARQIADNFRLLRSAPLRVGVLPTIGPIRLARFLEAFRERNPGVEVTIEEGGIDELARRIEAGEIDLALATLLSSIGPQLRTETVYRERYVVVFAPGHRFEKTNGISIGDLLDEPYVDRLSCEMREMVGKMCAERNVPLYASYRSAREDWVQAMVLARLGFAFMPEYSVTLPGLLSRPLIDPEVTRTIALIDRRGRRRTPAAQLFAQGIRTHRWAG